MKWMKVGSLFLILSRNSRAISMTYEAITIAKVWAVAVTPRYFQIRGVRQCSETLKNDIFDVSGGIARSSTHHSRNMADVPTITIGQTATAEIAIPDFCHGSRIFGQNCSLRYLDTPKCPRN